MPRRLARLVALSLLTIPFTEYATKPDGKRRLHWFRIRGRDTLNLPDLSSFYRAAIPGIRHVEY